MIFFQKIVFYKFLWILFLIFSFHLFLFQFVLGSEELSKKTVRPTLSIHPTMITSMSYLTSFFACGSTLHFANGGNLGYRCLKIAIKIKTIFLTKLYWKTYSLHLRTITIFYIGKIYMIKKVFKVYTRLGI